MRTRVLIAVAALSIAAASASGAGLKTESTTVTIAPETLGSATAKCKQKRKVVSGGFSSPIDLTDPTVAAFTRTARRTGRRGWTAVANDPGGNAGELTVHAYCGKKQAFGKLKTKSATTTLAPGEQGPATAKCKRGAKAVSGGFFGEGLRIEESRKVGGRRWRVTAEKSGEDEGPGDLTAYATCREEEGLKARSATEPVPGHVVVTATAECKQGTKAVSGGFSAPRAPSGAARAIVTTSQKVGRRSWETTAYSFSSSLDPGELTGYVYCARTKTGKP